MNDNLTTADLTTAPPVVAAAALRDHARQQLAYKVVARPSQYRFACERVPDDD